MIEINPMGTDRYIITVKRPNKEIFQLLNIGATWLNWQTPKGVEIIARYHDLNLYPDRIAYLGATIGPFVGRIKNGRVPIGEQRFGQDDSLEHFLHGGHQGCAFIPFMIDRVQEDSEESVVVLKAEYVHPDLPGRYETRVIYTFRNRSVKVRFETKADTLTLCNMTQHAYFNLEGRFTSLEHHQLQIHGSQVVLSSEELLPERIVDVDHTPYNFRHPRYLHLSTRGAESANAILGGLDHYFILDRERTYDIRLGLPAQNRCLSIKSTYPGINVYSANVPPDAAMQNHVPMAMFGAIALEPQFMPSAPIDSRFTPYTIDQHTGFCQEIHYELEE